MVRASISGDGVGPQVRLHGKGNAAVYKQLVSDHVMPVLRHSSNLPSIFRQNNDPRHKAKLIKNFLIKGGKCHFYGLVSPDPQGAHNRNTYDIVTLRVPCKLDTN